MCTVMINLSLSFSLSRVAHTPDNSFLGFVVGSNLSEAMPYTKKNIGLVYGKELYMWQVHTVTCMFGFMNICMKV